MSFFWISFTLCSYKKLFFRSLLEPLLISTLRFARRPRVSGRMKRLSAIFVDWIDLWLISNLKDSNGTQPKATILGTISFTCSISKRKIHWPIQSKIGMLWIYISKMMIDGFLIWLVSRWSLKRKHKRRTKRFRIKIKTKLINIKLEQMRWAMSRKKYRILLLGSNNDRYSYC